MYIASLNYKLAIYIYTVGLKKLLGLATER
jgi:hypothetical protein